MAKELGPRQEIWNLRTKGMKKCTGCDMVKSFDQFYHNRHNNDGLQSYCKECTKKTVANEALSGTPEDRISVKGDYAEVIMPCGTVIMVDIEDLPLVRKYRWRMWKVNKSIHKYYVKCMMPDSDGHLHIHQLHREIAGSHPGDLTDHINGDTLDYRRSNLRITDASGNSHNRCKSVKETSSRYKGVHRERIDKWHAQIMVKKVLHHLGTFDNERDAALAYNEAARSYFGEFANLNDV